MKFDRKVYFDEVRDSLFGGSLTQGQVTGQEALLTAWEKHAPTDDIRHFGYMLATTKHETASTMLPIEEYGKGQGQPYGKQDPETKQTYYGRGFVQLTWRDNYARATRELGLEGADDLEWHAARALDPFIAAKVMGRGMTQGWFRRDNKGPQTLSRYFNDDMDDPYDAREIINGDKTKVPSWSHGVSIGSLIVGHHDKFVAALETSIIREGPPQPDVEMPVVTITVVSSVPIKLVVQQP